MSNNVKKILIVVLVLIAILSFGLIYFKLTHKTSPKIEEVKKEDEIQTKEFYAQEATEINGSTSGNEKNVVNKEDLIDFEYEQSIQEYKLYLQKLQI